MPKCQHQSKSQVFLVHQLLHHSEVFSEQNIEDYNCISNSVFNLLSDNTSILPAITKVVPEKCGCVLGSIHVSMFLLQYINLS